MAVPIPRRRFTVKEYHQMGQAGIFTEDDRVELLDGQIVEMSPIGPRHAAAVDRLAGLFFRRFGGAAIVRVQNPIRLSNRSEPQPDLALLRPRADFYARAHPRPEDVLLVVEVADTSAAFDRQLKLPLYARAGIPEVWLLVLGSTGAPPGMPADAAGRAGPVLEVYRRPSPQGYSEIRLLRRGEGAAPAPLPELEVPVADLLDF